MRGAVSRQQRLVSAALAAAVVAGGWLVAGAPAAAPASLPSSAVTAFGDASLFGPTAAAASARSIVGIAASPTGRGFWLVASNGRVFAFGDAHFHGSLGATTLNQPIVGIAATHSGHGYWLVASDGGIFTFGDAPFLGSLGETTPATPIVGMAASRGRGYWIVTHDPEPMPGGVGGPSHIVPNFKPMVPGAPVIRARLDDFGLHFTPSHIAAGTYNLAFSDARTDRIPDTDVALHIYVSGPGYSMLSVHAGQTGGGLLCSGAVSEGVTVDHYDLAVGGSNPGLTIDPSPACPTPVT